MPAKKNPDMTPAMKTVHLYSLLLFSGRRHSLTALAKQLDCSKQTVLKRILDLELVPGMQIESEIEKRERWYRLTPPAEMKTIMLTPGMIQQLMLCRDFVWNLLPKSLQEDVTHTIGQTAKLVHDFEGKNVADCSSTASHAKGMIDYSGKEPIIQDILMALNKSRLCQITYRSGAQKTSKLTIIPRKLIAHRDGLYLRCQWANQSKEDQHEILLAVHRIHSLTLLKETAPKAVAESKKADLGTFGIFPGKPFRVKVRISKDAALYVSERIWSDDQNIKKEKGGGILLEFTATSEREVLSWVLGFGAEAELLEPEKLRKTVMDTTEKMRVVYLGE